MQLIKKSTKTDSKLKTVENNSKNIDDNFNLFLELFSKDSCIPKLSRVKFHFAKSIDPEPEL
jgi:hypothetical protein